MLNKVQIIGHLGHDPEVRYTQSGTAVVNATITTNEVWKDKGGQKQERTEWHRVVLFGRTAEVADEYLNKGSLVYVEGRLQTRKWTTDGGDDRYTTEIVASEMKMLGGKNGAAHREIPGEQRTDGSAPAVIQSPPRPATAGANFDDDIPF